MAQLIGLIKALGNSKKKIMNKAWKTKQTDRLRRLSSIYSKRLDQDLKTIVGCDDWVSAFDKEVSFFEEYEEVDEEEAFKSIMKAISIKKANQILLVFEDVKDIEFREEILSQSINRLI